jgi:hypothetical protein
MPRGRSNFRQRDITAAIKAVRAGGLAVARIDVGERGGFKVIIGDAAPIDADAVQLGTQQIDEVIKSVYAATKTTPGETRQKRPSAARLARAKPPRQR